MVMILFVEIIQSPDEGQIICHLKITDILSL